jgi:hypothetical protein
LLCFIINKLMKFYEGELITFFVSGKDAKVYNGFWRLSLLQGGYRILIFFLG